MDKTKSTLPCGIKPEQLAEWKAKYKEVFVVTCEHEGKTYEGIFRKPGMAEFTKVVKYLAPDPNEPMPKAVTGEDGSKNEPAAPMPRNMIKAGLIYFLDCKLACDPEMDTIEEVKVAACIRLVGMFRMAEATIKNL